MLIIPNLQLSQVKQQNIAIMCSSYTTSSITEFAKHNIMLDKGTEYAHRCTNIIKEL